jgi:MFS family permease
VICPVVLVNGGRLSSFATSSYGTVASVLSKSAQPMLPGRTRYFIAAMLIDSVGSGLLGPFLLFYGHAVAGMDLGTAGVALALAAGLAIPLGPLAGAVVDRLGSGRVAITANLVAALGCALLLAAHDPLSFGVSSFILAAGTRLFWAAFAPLVLAVATGSQRVWFGRIHGLRYTGIAAGQMLASAIFLLGEVRGMRAVVVADAVSYVLAGGLLWVATRGMNTDPQHADDGQRTGYRAVLKDRGNVALAAMNVIATLLVTAPLLAMPILVIDQLHFAVWLPALLGALNTVSIAVLTFFVARILGRRPSLTALVVAALMWAAGCFAYAVASLDILAVALLPLGIVALGLAEAAYAPSADSLPLELAPAGLTGRYTAVHQLGWGVSAAIAPVLAGALLAAGRPTLWLVLGAASLALALGYAVARASLFDRLRVA